MTTISLNDLTHCVFDPLNVSVVDAILPNGDMMHGSGNAEAYVKGKPLMITTLEEAHRIRTEHCKEVPTLITQEHWQEMLEVMPPDNWSGGEHSETFALCERLMGPITRLYCRIGDRYFSLADHWQSKTDDIVHRCEDAYRDQNKKPIYLWSRIRSVESGWCGRVTSTESHGDQPMLVCHCDSDVFGEHGSVERDDVAYYSPSDVVVIGEPKVLPFYPE